MKTLISMIITSNLCDYCRGNSNTLGTVRTWIPSHFSPEEGEIYTVKLHRGSRGFGFSIRGGREFINMPLFVLHIADGGAADLDGRLKVGMRDWSVDGSLCLQLTLEHFILINNVQLVLPLIGWFGHVLIS